MRLASMMGLSGNVLHPSFDFPAGSFFWCRPRAMQPLLSLGLDWTDYPEEPLSHDGTILHAIERMLTFSCEEAGFEYRTVHVADTSR
jgi:lipopolysaccharide biosynthesis protein